MYVFHEKDLWQQIFMLPKCLAALQYIPSYHNSLTHWGRDKMAANIADDIYKWSFKNENCCLFIKISLKYFCKGSIDNNPALVQIMAWCRTGDKSLSELMMASFGPPHSLSENHNTSFPWLLLHGSAWLMMTSSNGNIFRVTGHLCG